MRFEALGDAAIALTGTIECLGAIVVEVEKVLSILSGSGPGAVVQTTAYRYHARIVGPHNILRYENADHRGTDHVHRYAALDDGRKVTVTPIAREQEVPTLGDVPAELRDWYYEHQDAIEGEG